MAAHIEGEDIGDTKSECKRSGRGRKLQIIPRLRVNKVELGTGRLRAAVMSKAYQGPVPCLEILDTGNGCVLPGGWHGHVDGRSAAQFRGLARPVHGNEALDCKQGTEGDCKQCQSEPTERLHRQFLPRTEVGAYFQCSEYTHILSIYLAISA